LVQVEVALQPRSGMQVLLLSVEEPKQERHTVGWLSTQVAQGMRQLTTHTPSLLGL
jgi:hypothetical protein